MKRLILILIGAVLVVLASGDRSDAILIRGAASPPQTSFSCLATGTSSTDCLATGTSSTDVLAW